MKKKPSIKLTSDITRIASLPASFVFDNPVLPQVIIQILFALVLTFLLENFLYVVGVVDFHI